MDIVRSCVCIFVLAVPAFAGGKPEHLNAGARHADVSEPIDGARDGITLSDRPQRVGENAEPADMVGIAPSPAISETRKSVLPPVEFTTEVALNSLAAKSAKPADAPAAFSETFDLKEAAPNIASPSAPSVTTHHRFDSSYTVRDGRTRAYHTGFDETTSWYTHKTVSVHLKYSDGPSGLQVHELGVNEQKWEPIIDYVPSGYSRFLGTRPGASMCTLLETAFENVRREGTLIKFDFRPDSEYRRAILNTKTGYLHLISVAWPKWLSFMNYVTGWSIRGHIVPKP